MAGVKQKKKQRTVYSYKTTLYKLSDDNLKEELAWNSNVIKSIIEKILKLSEADRRTVDFNSEWSMHLSKGEIDPVKPNIITGCFNSTKQGLRTKVEHIETGDIKDNPKPPGYNEIRTTCFAFRLTDGLFMLADYGDNVATTTRIAEYFTNFSKRLCPEFNLFGIHFDHLISHDFLEKLNSFERINALEILIDSTQEEADVDDALSTLNAELAAVKQQKIMLILKRGDSPSLSPKGLYDWVKSKMTKHTILQGKITGKPTPGNPKELRLTGMEEKYFDKFPIDKEEEVLTQPLFDFIIKKVEERASIS